MLANRKRELSDELKPPIGGVHVRMFATARTNPSTGLGSYMATLGVLQTVNVGYTADLLGAIELTGSDAALDKQYGTVRDLPQHGL